MWDCRSSPAILLVLVRRPPLFWPLCDSRCGDNCEGERPAQINRELTDKDFGQMVLEHMPLPRENREVDSQSLFWPCSLRIALTFLLFVGAAAHSAAQVPTSAAPPAKVEPATPVDPLERETPRRAVMSLLKYGERRDFATASRFLQPVPGQDVDLVQRARKFRRCTIGSKATSTY